MPYLVISDIHANADALFAVLEDARKRGNIEKILCLGDITGYAAEPGHCITIARELGFTSVKGNHDLAVSGEMGTGDFNGDAAEAAAWQKGRIGLDDRQWLRQLPLTTETGEFTLVHGSPRDPVWEYVTEPRQAAASLAFARTRFCLVGHTHRPMYFIDRGGRAERRLFRPGEPVKLGGRMMINPGSVGQPRDGDARSSYLVYDDRKGEICNYRVAYDIEAAQAKIRRQGLPAWLAQRLQSGA